MQNKNILSTAAQNALPSGVRRMFELAKKYPDSINLTLGEPGFVTLILKIKALPFRGAFSLYRRRDRGYNTDKT